MESERDLALKVTPGTTLIEILNPGTTSIAVSFQQINRIHTSTQVATVLVGREVKHRQQKLFFSSGSGDSSQ
jgi:hypothetical protein